MRKLILRGIILFLGVILVAAVFSVVVKTRRHISQQQEYFSRKSPDVPVVVQQNRGLILVMAEMEIPVHELPNLSSEERFFVDGDLDGVFLLDELAQLTSDHHQDSDRDGVSDASDSSPNSPSLHTTIEGELVNTVIADHLEAMGMGEKPARYGQFRTSYLGCYSRHDSVYSVVCATELDMAMLSTVAPINTFRIEKYLAVPGFAYVVSSWFECGPQGHDERFFLILDTPGLGPTVLTSWRPD